MDEWQGEGGREGGLVTTLYLSRKCSAISLTDPPVTTTVQPESAIDLKETPQQTQASRTSAVTPLALSRQSFRSACWLAACPSLCLLT